MEIEQGAEPIEVGAGEVAFARISLHIHLHEIVADLAVDGGESADRVDRDRVINLVGGFGAVATKHLGAAGVGAVDQEHIGARAQPKFERLNVGVVDTGSETQAPQAVAHQGAGFGDGVAGVVDREQIFLVCGSGSATVDHDQPLHSVNLADRGRHRGGDAVDSRSLLSLGIISGQESRIGKIQLFVVGFAEIADVDAIAAGLAIDRHCAAGAAAANPDEVVAFLGVDRELAVGVVDLDLISTRSAEHVGGRAVGGIHQQMVSLCTHPEIQRFQIAVVDALLQLHAPQAECGGVHSIQDPCLGVGSSGVVDVELVA